MQVAMTETIILRQAIRDLRDAAKSGKDEADPWCDISMAIEALKESVAGITRLQVELERDQMEMGETG